MATITSDNNDENNNNSNIKNNNNRNRIPIIIDGSQGEGGGQILRNSVSYAAILQVPLRIHSIRAKRSKAGLQAQHVAAISLAAELGGGTLEGATLGSTEIQYLPAGTTTTDTASTTSSSTTNSQDDSREQIFHGTIATAGSICLLLQAALPVALMTTLQQPDTASNAPATNLQLNLKGGTNASMAPQYDYWERIFLPIVRHCFGIPPGLISATVLKRGYFPRGGGHVQVTLAKSSSSTCIPLPLPSFQMIDRGTVTKVSIRAFHAGTLPNHLATQMGQAAQKRLEDYFQSTATTDTIEQGDNSSSSTPPLIELEVVTEPNAVGSGLGLLLVATTSTGCLLGGSALCKPKADKRMVGRQAAEELIDALQNGGCVDEWLQDQLILYMALAKGTSQLLTGSLTLHTQTAIHIAQQLVPGIVFNVERLVDASSPDVSQDSGSTNNNGPYGQDGRIPGKHMITCHGIGYTGR